MFDNIATRLVALVLVPATSAGPTVGNAGSTPTGSVAAADGHACC